jgi:hypothetical protein
MLAELLDWGEISGGRQVIGHIREVSEDEDVVEDLSQ